VLLFGVVTGALAAASKATGHPAPMITVLALTIAAPVGGIWLLVRTCLWFQAIVADNLGPLEGLRASFDATRGRWWLTAALMLLTGAAAALITGAFDAVGQAAKSLGGPEGAAMQLAIGLLGLAGTVYVFTWATAVTVCYYLGIRSAGAADGQGAGA
jgi:hypothetical protein